MHSTLSTRAKRSALTLAAAGVLVAIALPPRIAAAAGALAVAMPADVRQGFSSGHSVNDATPEAASEKAIDGCHKGVGNANQDIRKLCKVVATFHDQCYAVAMDPKDGTPGVGWAIGETQEVADSRALAQCKTTAGASRRQFCTVNSRDRGCDGNAK
jgi:hypothetical protein